MWTLIRRQELELSCIELANSEVVTSFEVAQLVLKPESLRIVNQAAGLYPR